MMLQSIETGREVLLSTHHILKGMGEKRLKDSDCFLWLLKRNTPPCARPNPIPLFFQGISSHIRQKVEERISQADV
jgi:hypothetical protein